MPTTKVHGSPTLFFEPKTDLNGVESGLASFGLGFYMTSGELLADDYAGMNKMLTTTNILYQGNLVDFATLSKSELLRKVTAELIGDHSRGIVEPSQTLQRLIENSKEEGEFFKEMLDGAKLNTSKYGFRNDPVQEDSDDYDLQFEAELATHSLFTKDCLLDIQNEHDSEVAKLKQLQTFDPNDFEVVSTANKYVYTIDISDSAKIINMQTSIANLGEEHEHLIKALEDDEFITTRALSLDEQLSTITRRLNDEDCPKKYLTIKSKIESGKYNEACGVSELLNMYGYDGLEYPHVQDHLAAVWNAKMLEIKAINNEPIEEFKVQEELRIAKVCGTSLGASLNKAVSVSETNNTSKHTTRSNQPATP